VVWVGVVGTLVVPALLSRAIEHRAQAAESDSRVSLASIGIGRASSPTAGAAPHKPIGPVDPLVRNRLDSLERQLEAHSDDDSTRLGLARLLEDSHRLPRAIETYRAYLVRHPADIDAWLDLGRALASSGDLDGATESMETVLDLDPIHPSALYNMGAIAANLGRNDEAAEWWRRVIHEADGSPMAGRATASLERISRVP